MSDMNRTEFEARLQTLLNSMSMENESNTPDFILAQYMLRCLEAFNAAVTMREKWYGRWDEDSPGTKVVQEPSETLPFAQGSNHAYTQHVATLCAEAIRSRAKDGNARPILRKENGQWMVYTGTGVPRPATPDEIRAKESP